MGAALYPFVKSGLGIAIAKYRLHRWTGLSRARGDNGISGKSSGACLCLCKLKQNGKLAHTAVAERIATNARTLFAHRYLTPAAIACYWRSALREYVNRFRNLFYSILI